MDYKVDEAVVVFQTIHEVERALVGLNDMTVEQVAGGTSPFLAALYDSLGKAISPFVAGTETSGLVDVAATGGDDGTIKVTVIYGPPRNVPLTVVRTPPEGE
jgi:hypothetical protein